MPTMPSLEEQEEARQILGVRAGANKREIRSAYLRLMMRYHTDKGGNKTQAQRLNEAFALLKNLAPPPPGPAEERVPPACPPAGPGERGQARSEARYEEDDSGPENDIRLCAL